jgi:hypothetical protein
MSLLQAFPLPSTLGEVTLHQFSQAGVFIYSSCGKWVFSLSCGVFLPPPLLQAFRQALLFLEPLYQLKCTLILLVFTLLLCSSVWHVDVLDREFRGVNQCH